jgi:hypothetical protein
MSHTLQIPLKSSRSRESGFTLTELLGICAILGLLATIGINMATDLYEKARLARCLMEVRGIQAAVWDMSQEGEYIPDPVQFWESAFPDGRRHGPYYYIVDGDPNKGHGNDLDEVDEENPGASDPDKKDIKFVIFCEHDHKHLCKYVYVLDEEPPQLATEENDPGYTAFIKWEYGGPGAAVK